MNTAVTREEMNQMTITSHHDHPAKNYIHTPVHSNLGSISTSPEIPSFLSLIENNISTSENIPLWMSRYMTISPNCATIIFPEKNQIALVNQSRDKEQINNDEGEKQTHPKDRMNTTSERTETDDTPLRSHLYIPGSVKHFWECRYCCDNPISYRPKFSVAYTGENPPDMKSKLVRNHLKVCLGRKRKRDRGDGVATTRNTISIAKSNAMSSIIYGKSGGGEVPSLLDEGDGNTGGGNAENFDKKELEMADQKRRLAESQTTSFWSQAFVERRSSAGNAA